MLFNGGNSYGAAYGAFNGLGDGFHMGYNAYYVDNVGWTIPVSGGATSRISMWYGAVGIYTGATNVAPTNLGYYQVSDGRAAINSTSPGTGFQFDVNGTSRGAIYYSSVATAVTITPGGDFGVYYNLTASGSYTITVAGSQATSNIGKFYLLRNNSGGSLSVTFTGGTGITSPITISSNASATIVVTGTGGTYALF
jgi:hypothetical protein